MKKTVLIGHRGVGKSLLLRRIKEYYDGYGEEITCIDLDQEIETRIGLNISEIFQKYGEDEFRRIELEKFQEIGLEVEKKRIHVYIAVGAGFDPGLIPENYRCLWVRRFSDERGRIFFDRPKLDKTAGPLAEFQGRFKSRDDGFRRRADRVFFLEEGLELADPIENRVFLNQIKNIGGAITLLPENFKNGKFSQWFCDRSGWGIRWFELRDDLLSEQQMATSLSILPRENVLVSLRSPDRERNSFELVGRYQVAFDWPLERGPCTYSRVPYFFSIHDRGEQESITGLLEKLSRHHRNGEILKVAIVVHDFHELLQMHHWQSENPNERVFLPRSLDGRWAWYRLIQQGKVALNFFRESDGSGSDQPTLMQWLRNHERSRSSENFTAVLGDPVSHSRTPIVQNNFFSKNNVPVFSIRLTEQDWKMGALDQLRQLGLKWAAVTAPLKNLAFEACTERSPIAEELKSVNTLFWNDVEKYWSGTNTDFMAFSDALKKISFDEPVAVWGGGGTLQMLRTVLPKAHFFSSRSGENRFANGLHSQGVLPKTLIWAVNRHRHVGMPPSHWHPEIVIDLDYAEDSPGREFAQERGSSYISGLQMFYLQAKLQRKFWEKM